MGSDIAAKDASRQLAYVCRAVPMSVCAAAAGSPMLPVGSAGTECFTTPQLCVS